MKAHGSIKFFTAPLAMIHNVCNQLFCSCHTPTTQQEKDDDVQIPIHPNSQLEETPVPGNAPSVLHSKYQIKKDVFFSSLQARDRVPKPRKLTSKTKETRTVE